MKKLIPILLFLLQAAFVNAQSIKSFALSSNGDTLNITDNKDLKQGKWVIHVNPLRSEPGFEEEGEYIDNLREGIWRKYNLTGDILAVENYKWGFKDGKQMYFTNIGDLLREESWMAVNPKNPYDTIDVPDLDNPIIMVKKIIKHEASELRHGIWKFYNPSNGSIVKTESFLFGLKTDANGRPILDNKQPTTVNTQPTKPVSTEKPKAKPAAVEEWEKKNAGKKKIVVRDGKTGN